MEIVKLKAIVRQQFGKGPSRRIRRADQIPAVIYGKGMETTSVTLSPKELADALSTEYGPNRIIEMDIESKGTQRVLLQEYQRHPVSRQFLHADFKSVDDATKVDVEVPLNLVGKSKGAVMGGVVRAIFRKLPVRCLPGSIPSVIEHDVSELDLEDIISVSDLKLPEGVEVLKPPQQTVGGVYGSKRKVEEEESAETTEAEAAPAAEKKS